MTQEQKDLLLKDLCTRLSYGVICEDGYGNVLELNGIDKPNTITFKCSNNTFWTTDLDKCKPYLFPLSSMTEGLIHEFYCMFIENDISFEDFVADYWNTNSFHKLMTSIDDCGRVVEWFNKNHCDYKGLISMGLANDATGLNIY